MSAISHLPTTADVAPLAKVSGAPRPLLLHDPTALGRTDEATVLSLPRPPAPMPSPEPVIPDELETLARKVARGALEVLGGTRPLQQMARMLDARSYERLQLRSNLVRSIEQTRGSASGGRTGSSASRLHRNVLIRSVRICPITASIFEVSVVAAEQQRARAIALRIERWRGQWRVTELQIG
ncbi:hypothetical protein GCM10009784_00120 [Arthrobacter parietis]|uniref:Rv3235 family protein n=2 Tax=Arthrobacter TaxID=1663 RepID=A0ABT6CUS4_9MICC|nr:Rv3235 family protein [Arthrobacter vasquezii]MDF9277833.1 Rv3235 family protein [Arthrobacter vasquezii]